MHVENDYFCSKSSTLFMTPYLPRAPFPQCLDAPSPFVKKDAKFEDILKVFKQVRINLFLPDAIKQIPTYAKYLKTFALISANLKVMFPKRSYSPSKLVLFFVALLLLSTKISVPLPFYILLETISLIVPSQTQEHLSIFYLSRRTSNQV